MLLNNGGTRGPFQLVSSNANNGQTIHDENAGISNRNKNNISKKAPFGNDENSGLLKTVKLKSNSGGLRLQTSSSSSAANNIPKTPSTQGTINRRRALGDISNRKLYGDTGGTSSIKPTTNSSKQVSFLSPAVNLGGKHLANKTGIRKKKSSDVPLSLTPSVDSKLREFVLPQKSVTFDANDKISAEKQQDEEKLDAVQKAKYTIAPDVIARNLEPVEDIELPAGRLWHQERGLLDREGKDNWQPDAELLSYGGAADDHLFMIENEREAIRMENERIYEEIDAAFDAQVKKFAMENEDENANDYFCAMDSMYESLVKDLAHDPDLYGDGFDDDFDIGRAHVLDISL